MLSVAEAPELEQPSLMPMTSAFGGYVENISRVSTSCLPAEWFLLRLRRIHLLYIESQFWRVSAQAATYLTVQNSRTTSIAHFTRSNFHKILLRELGKFGI